MCTPNKFLEGRLCWFPEKQVVAVIGHCCADKENEAASRAEDIKFEEQGYLLATLPLSPEKLCVVNRLLPKAHEANRLFNKFRSDCRELHAELRQLKRVDGDLTVYIETERPRDSEGPAAFGGSNIDRQAVSFGKIAGTEIFSSKLDLVEQLMTVKRLIEKSLQGEDEMHILNYIVELDLFPDGRAALCAELRDADRRYREAVASLIDVASFFEGDNLSRLDAWGTHPANPLGLTVSIEDRHGVSAIVIESSLGTTRLSPAEVLFLPFEDWPTPLAPKRPVRTAATADRTPPPAAAGDSEPPSAG